MGIGIETEFDATELCSDEGEIGLAIKHLYDLCEKHGVPLCGFVITASTDNDNSFRGFQVVPNKELAHEFLAARLAVESTEVTKLVLGYYLSKKLDLEDQDDE